MGKPLCNSKKKAFPVDSALVMTPSLKVRKFEIAGSYMEKPASGLSRTWQPQPFECNTQLNLWSARCLASVRMGPRPSVTQARDSGDGMSRTLVSATVKHADVAPTARLLSSLCGKGNLPALGG